MHAEGSKPARRLGGIEFSRLNEQKNYDGFDSSAFNRQSRTISFSAAHPASAATLQFVIYTNGWPAMAGLAAGVVGILLLFVALAFAVLAQIPPRGRAQHENASVAERR